MSERGDTPVATAVMVWDSAGAWRQAIFRPVQPRENLVVSAAEVDGPCR